MDDDILGRDDHLTQLKLAGGFMFGIPEPIAECVFILHVCAYGQTYGRAVAPIGLERHDGHTVCYGAQSAFKIREGIAIDRARLLLVAMCEAGMIVATRAPLRGQVDEARRTPRPVDLGTRSMPTSERSREELVALLAVMRSQSHFEVLGVERDATPAEIADAYQALARDFHPDLFRLRGEEVRDVARQIFERLEKAFGVLHDSGSRRKYLAELERTPLPAPANAQPAAGSESAATAAERVYFTGVSHLRARRYPQAAEAFGQATALAPKQASYRSALGWALYRQAPADSHAVAAGLAELRRSVECEPTNPWVRISLGRFYAETGLPDDAIREFEAALGMSPGLADIEEEIRRLKGET